MLPTDPVIEKCECCHKEALYDIEPCCRACNHPVAARAPNVTFAKRFASLIEERYRAACDEAEKRGSAEALLRFQAIAAGTVAVVNTKARMAYGLFSDPSLLYGPYKRQVAGGVRAPASFYDDRRRGVVDHLIYAGYGDDIVFAALSVDGRGLFSYGIAHLELDEKTVAFRATVLEENSYHFVDRHSLRPEEPFPGEYLALWEDRHKLAVAKLAEKIGSTETAPEYSELFLKCDGYRDTDVFLEVHIYGTFNHQAVKSVRLSKPDAIPSLTQKEKEEETLYSQVLKERLKEKQVEWSGA